MDGVDGLVLQSVSDGPILTLITPLSCEGGRGGTGQNFPKRSKTVRALPARLIGDWIQK